MSHTLTLMEEMAMLVSGGMEKNTPIPCMEGRGRGNVCDLMIKCSSFFLHMSMKCGNKMIQPWCRHGRRSMVQLLAQLSNFWAMLAVCRWLSGASANKAKVQVLVSKLIVLQKHQEQHWCDAIIQIWQREVVIGRAEVSIVTPQPREKGDQCAEHCIHAIVWHKVDDKVRILIDRVLDGVPQDRSRWLINSTMVKNIFVHVGWDGFGIQVRPRRWWGLVHGGCSGASFQ